MQRWEEKEFGISGQLRLLHIFRICIFAFTRKWICSLGFIWSAVKTRATCFLTFRLNSKECQHVQNIQYTCWWLILTGLLPQHTLTVHNHLRSHLGLQPFHFVQQSIKPFTLKLAQGVERCSQMVDIQHYVAQHTVDGCGQLAFLFKIQWKPMEMRTKVDKARNPRLNTWQSRSAPYCIGIHWNME